jgi:hypothetical protein
MYVKLSWRPEVYENWAIMVVQQPILTYPTMVFYFWLPPQVLWNDLRGIVIKESHWQTMGICLIYMSSLYFWSPSFARKVRKTNMRYYPEYPSGSWHQLSWRPEVYENWAIMVVQPPILTYPTMVFNFWLPPQVLWNDLNTWINMCAGVSA